jgi:hypothetical protein
MNAAFKNRLLNFQCSPSQNIWKNITNSLDGDTDYLFTEKMYHYQTTPQLQVWDKISKELDEGITPVIPIRRRYYHALKFTGIAVLIAGVILAAFFVSNDSTRPEALTAKKQPPVIRTQSPQKTFSPLDSEDETIIKKRADVGLNENRNNRIARSAPIASLVVSKPPSLLKTRGSMIVASNTPLVQSEFVDRYIVFSKATGEAVKLSKKLFSLFACYDEDQNCKRNIEKVQSKMASPAMMASADFTSVLEVLQTMEN